MISIKKASWSLLWILAAFFSVMVTGTLICSAEETPVITFTDDDATISQASDVVIEGTTVTISGAGTYVLTGECANGSVTVAKNAGAVQLILNGLNLTCTTSAPLETKGGTTEVIITAAEGTENVISDTYREAAKPKSALNASKAITLNGSGSLIVNGNNKNGIKSDTDVTIEELKLEVNSLDHGIAADNLLTVNSGTITVNSGGDAMRSSPDEITDDTAGDVTINGGTFYLTSVGDGIQADHYLTIAGGNFVVQTNGGYQTVVADDADSCKGFKAGDTLAVLAGTYQMNTADDAFHSDAYCYITSGDIQIATGDDGVHANTSLIIGQENGDDGDLKVLITNCYEGLEAGTVYIYSGNIDVTATDDGINAAGDSGSNDSFNPGGGGGSFPGGGSQGSNVTNPGNTTTSDYSINIYGGTLWVDAEGDGLDSNGDISISAGTITVFGAAANGSSADNAPLDFDGSCSVTGGTLFAAGSVQMVERPTISGQYQVEYSLSQNKYINALKYVNIYNGDTAIFSVQLPKAVNYILYTSADLDSNATVTTSDSPAYIEPEEEDTDETESESNETNSGETNSGESNSGETNNGDDNNGEDNSGEDNKENSTETEKTDQDNTGGTSTDQGSAAQNTTDQTTTGTTSQTTTVTNKVLVPTLKITRKNYRALTLKWTKINGAESYQIYRSTKKNGTYKKIKTTKSTSYTNTGLKTGQKYYYKVRAKVNGSWQSFSSVVGKKTVLGKTKIKKVTTKNNSVLIKWKKRAGASGYEIYYSTTKSSDYKKLTTVKKNKGSVTISNNLKSGKTYYFKVRAYRLVNDKKVYGGFSNPKKKKV